MPPSYTGPVPEKETAAYRAARLAVIVLSALIVLAVIALIVGGIAKLSGRKSAGPASGTSFQLPAGARIVSMETEPGRLILRVRDGDKEEIDIFDTQDGRLVGQVKASVGRAR
ncbi:MAG: hypothetical protein J0G99_08350 [Alphaproteobacteria bacterium]|nr:hypothetical protein [Alphaproteobacteria bacterium]